MTSLSEIFSAISGGVHAVSDAVCGYPLFIWLIGGGLFLFVYSGAVPVRHLGDALKSLRLSKQTNKGGGQISSFQALMSTISATVGMGNIAGVAIAIVVGGPGAIFWMWVSAVVGMATKFFEGTLAIMYKGRDDRGEVRGGPMYIITCGLGERWKPLAVAFAVVGMVGCLCVMQANQLTESVLTMLAPRGVADTLGTRALIGIIMGGIVAAVILGGIQRISRIASRIVPLMVGLYMLLVAAIIIMNVGRIPAVFAEILSDAFTLRAGWGGLAFTAITGARRAMYVNEAGVGTASLMHGAMGHKTKRI